MDFIEKESLSLAEAVFAASLALGIDEKSAQVQVLSAPGARRVRVRVGRPGASMPALDTAPEAPASPGAAAPSAEPSRIERPADYAPRSSARHPPAPEFREQLRTDLEKLLALMSVPSKVEVKEHAGNVVLNISGEKEGLLIGKRGATLDALQDSMEAIAKKATNDPDTYVVVDVADYRIRNERKIMDKARELAQKVMSEGGQLSMGPLSPAERRVVHLEIKSMEGVESFSVGSGSMKKLVIQKKT